MNVTKAKGRTHSQREALSLTTPAQKVALRMSEVRQRLATIGATDDLTDEIRSELGTLRTEYTDLETRSQALILAGDGEQEPEAKTGDAESRELLDLERRSNLGELFDAVLEQRQIDGPIRELQQHVKLGGNQIPLSLLRHPEGELELRTSGNSAAPTNSGRNQRPIIPAVFPQGAATFLGIPQPTVPVGDAVFTVLSTSVSPGTPAEGAQQAHSAAAFSAEVLSPARIQASLFYTREDRARLAGMDSALRQNLNMALGDELDDVILSGTNGLLNGTVLANHDVTAVTDFAGYRTNLVFGRVDGKYASIANDIRVLMGSGSYAHASGIYRSTTADYSALDALMRVADVRVSDHVPAASGNKQNVLIRRGMREDYVSPIWEGITLIVDEITQAQQGEIKLTAVMLYATKLLRADGFYKQQTQHA